MLYGSCGGAPSAGIVASHGPTSTETAEENLDQLHRSQDRTWSRWVRLTVYVVCGAAFVADLTQSATLAFGLFYMPLVSTAVYHQDPRAPWWLACLATAMVAIGYFFPSINPDIVAGILNRVLSIAAIFVTAYLVHHERAIRDRLAEQTARAEAADQAKTQLFNNLSHELRTPLSAVLGYADLLIAEARPDQRVAIGHIQGGGRRLLSTLDNLIDLTQIADRQLHFRKLDLVSVLMQAVEAARPLAAEKRIALAIAEPDAEPPLVTADPWALRRILDNLISNAIKFTEAGGAVEISARRTDDGVIAVVKDTGAGMPVHVLEQIGDPFYQAESGAARRFEGMGTGLALSLRLADAMSAALHFDSTLGGGTTASLVMAPA